MLAARLPANIAPSYVATARRHNLTEAPEVRKPLIRIVAPKPVVHSWWDELKEVFS